MPAIRLLRCAHVDVARLFFALVPVVALAQNMVAGAREAIIDLLPQLTVLGDFKDTVYPFFDSDTFFLE